jgi:uncharacterized membrane protein
MNLSYRSIVGPLMGMALASVIVILFPVAVLYFFTAIVTLLVLVAMYNESRR